MSRKFLKCAYAARFHISSSKSRLPLDELVKVSCWTGCARLVGIADKR